MVGIVWLAVFCVFCLSVSSKVIATSYRDPTSKTNVNVQTDLFRKSVGDVQAFKSQIQEEEREAMLVREREVSEMKTRFISVASHEFRTPMAAALGSLDLLANHLERLPAAKQQELLSRAATSLHRMTGLLDEVLVALKGA